LVGDTTDTVDDVGEEDRLDVWE
jgi:hypothetical protein